jgi:glucose-6-phosphate-specific signal transduction histidine kinase
MMTRIVKLEKALRMIRSKVHRLNHDDLAQQITAIKAIISTALKKKTAAKRKLKDLTWNDMRQLEAKHTATVGHR